MWKCTILKGRKAKWVLEDQVRELEDKGWALGDEGWELGDGWQIQKKQYREKIHALWWEMGDTGVRDGSHWGERLETVPTVCYNLFNNYIIDIKGNNFQSV